jgi:hypothetical protein
MLINTGTELVRSKNGLLTTPAYKFGDDPVVYALEGSIAVTGSAVQWLRDQLGIIRGAEESETLARSVDAMAEDSGVTLQVLKVDGGVTAMRHCSHSRSACERRNDHERSRAVSPEPMRHRPGQSTSDDAADSSPARAHDDHRRSVCLGHLLENPSRVASIVRPSPVDRRKAGEKVDCI